MRLREAARIVRNASQIVFEERTYSPGKLYYHTESTGDETAFVGGG